MKVIITGGAGFLGSHLCDILIQHGNEVVCIDNLLTGRLENVAHLRENHGFRFIEADVCNYQYEDGLVDAVGIGFKKQMDRKPTQCDVHRGIEAEAASVIGLNDIVQQEKILIRDAEFR